MDEEAYQRLAEIDHRRLWHPFTQMRTWLADEPVIIERADGNYLVDARGRRYLDGVSSLWCNVHGHRKPELDRAIGEQLQRIAHSTMLGLSHPAAIELGEKLVGAAPRGLSRVFYSDSGAEAVEVALRMAVEYWQLRGEPRRTRLLTLSESYHGDTVGAASLGYTANFHRHARPLLFPVLKIDPPHVYRFYRGMSEEEAERAALAGAAEVIARNRSELAALVIEPLMQGAAGMWAHSPRYLKSLATMAREAGALVAADEVATGFGRTGTLFACERAELSPDLLCLGKGMTGGYLPLAATLSTERIFEAFLGEPEEYRAFYYGHTYTGNPLAAAVALKSLELFAEERIIERIAPRIEQMGGGLRRRLGGHPHVADIRQWGLMAGVELMATPKARESYAPGRLTGARVARAARERGVIIRPLGDVVVLMPPLSVGESELDLLLEVVAEAVDVATDRG